MAWAARDGNRQLAFFGDRPIRFGLGDDAMWMGGADSWEWSYQYGPDPCPDLTWKDDPVEIEISIRRKP